MVLAFDGVFYKTFKMLQVLESNQISLSSKGTLVDPLMHAT